MRIYEFLGSWEGLLVATSYYIFITAIEAICLDQLYALGSVCIRGTMGTSSVFHPAGNKVWVLCHRFWFVRPLPPMADSALSRVLVR